LPAEALADPAHGTRVGVDGLELQALEPQVPDVGLIELLEAFRGLRFHGGVTS
jgi:hypothetical protein